MTIFKFFEFPEIFLLFFFLQRLSIVSRTFARSSVILCSLVRFCFTFFLFYVFVFCLKFLFAYCRSTVIGTVCVIKS